MKRLVLVLGFLAWLGSTDAHATPALLSFTGQLSTASGPVNGPVSITFAIFDAPTGGTSVWTDTVEVAADLGRVATTLGQHTPIGEAVFTGADRFLEIQVGGETLSPRLTITSVPYAIQSARAETAAATTDPNVQRRTSQNMTCPGGRLMRSISPAGDAICVPTLVCSVRTSSNPSANAVTAVCPAGYFLTGGGCTTSAANSLQNSWPKDGLLNSWTCNLSGTVLANITAYAVCCTLP